jgi:hypothetical protein
MRLSMVVVGSCVAVLMGCQGQDQSQPAQSNSVDSWLITYVNDAGVQNAIIRQQAMFPYHFVAESAALNELGRRDLEILAGHYRQYPGSLSIRRGEAAEPLYQARVATVMDNLRAAGVAAGRVQATSAPAGGDGAASSQVLTIMAKASAPLSTAAPAPAPTGNGASMGERP